MEKSYAITGANRGIGLEFVRQLLADSSVTVIAAVRSLQGDLRDLKKLVSESSRAHILECDTSKPSSISAFGAAVSDVLGASGQLHYLLNNAAINTVTKQTSLTLGVEDLHEHIDVNVLGPAKTVENLLPHLQDGSVVMNMTSGLGSCGRKINRCTVYSISKAALNMLTVHQAGHLKERGVKVICMDPGWVKTDMGGDDAILEPKDSIRSMLNVLHGLKEDDTGKFYQYDGAEEPW